VIQEMQREIRKERQKGRKSNGECINEKGIYVRKICLNYLRIFEENVQNVFQKHLN
jgi:hypothetical protein